MKMLVGLWTSPRRYCLRLGTSWDPVGSFQNQIEANQRLMLIIPIVILLDLLIIYLNFRNLPLTLIIFSQIPIAISINRRISSPIAVIIGRCRNITIRSVRKSEEGIIFRSKNEPFARRRSPERDAQHLLRLSWA